MSNYNTHHYTPNQHILLIADTHITSDNDPICTALMQTIQKQSQSVAAIYLLGDIFEYWSGQNCQARYQHLLTYLKKQAQYCPLFFLSGNRDFLICPALLAQYNIQKISDPSIIQIGDSRTLLTHGDQLCTQDRSYQYLRLFLQNPVSLFIIRNLPYRLCLWGATTLRKKSQISTKNKPAHQLKACLYTIENWLQSYSAQRIVYGHVHQLSICHYRKQKNH